MLLTAIGTASGQDIERLLKSNIPDMYKADSLDLLGRKYMMKLKYDSAKYCLDLATQLALKSENSNIIARCYIDYANMYFLLTRFKEAEKYMRLAGPYLERADIFEVKTTGLMIWANLFNSLGKKDSALFYYRQAENYNADKLPYRNWLVYTAIGEMYNQADDFETAEKYFLKAYSITVKQAGKPDHMYLLTIFLNFYLSANLPDNAGPLIQEYNELQEERKRKNITDPLRDIMMGMTNSKLTNNLLFMKAVREKGVNTGLIQQALIANGYLMNYHEKKKEYGEALRYADDGVEMALKTGSIQNIYISKKARYNLLQKAGRYEEAARLADNLFDLKDSMLTLQKREQLYELETKFESEKQQQEIELLTSRNTLREKEIALLMADKRMAALLLLQETSQKGALTRENLLMDSIVKKEQAYSQAVNQEKEKQSALNEALGRENKLKETQLMKERNTKWILAGGVTLLLLSGITILILYSRQRKKSGIIEKQSADLEVLMKEIHHRVKNNLQIVSSLLDLQSHSITDVQAHEAVKEGKNRVQSMALIHQNLYREGNIKGIKVKEYVSNLLQTLCDSYNITNDKVKINANIDDLSLDVDTMIPLGLVLNELVSNAFKYAFKERQNGELTIVLNEEHSELHLSVSDNGKGFPIGMDISNNKSFGLKMIRAFAQKLKAKLDIYNRDGAVVEMRITKFKTA
ncbi:MAG: ATP-binding protein [Chitinophagaceae bacterium]|nr:ATP-binding protein [Chitinophagaceae bacterium]